MLTDAKFEEMRPRAQERLDPAHPPSCERGGARDAGLAEVTSRGNQKAVLGAGSALWTRPRLP